MKALYRIVNAVLGVLYFVAAFFLNFFRIEIETSDSLADFFYNLTDNKTGGVGIVEEFSIKRMIDVATGKDSLAKLLNIKVGDGNIYWPEELYGLNVRLVIFAVAIIISIAAALFVIIWSCCSNKHLPIFIAGLVGVVAIITMIASFNSMSHDIYYNKVNIVDFIVDQILGEGVLSSLIGRAASSAVAIELALAGVQNGLLFVFIGIVAWTGIFFLVDLGDPVAKAEKETEKAAEEKKKAEKAKAKAAKKAEKAAAKAEKSNA